MRRILPILLALVCWHGVAATLVVDDTQGCNLSIQVGASTNGSFGFITLAGMSSGIQTFNYNVLNPPGALYQWRVVVIGSSSNLSTVQASNSIGQFTMGPGCSATWCQGTNYNLTYTVWNNDSESHYFQVVSGGACSPAVSSGQLSFMLVGPGNSKTLTLSGSVPCGGVAPVDASSYLVYVPDSNPPYIDGSTVGYPTKAFPGISQYDPPGALFWALPASTGHLNFVRP